MVDRLSTLQVGMTASPARGGGLDRYFFGLVHALSGLGAPTRGLVLGTSADVAAQGVKDVEAYATDGAPLVTRWSALRVAMNKHLPQSDLLVSHFAAYTFCALDRTFRRPVVTHFHGSWARESETEGARRSTVWAKLAMEWLVYRGSARFIVLSNAAAEVLQRNFRIPLRLIRVVPGGVDIRSFRQTFTRTHARHVLGVPYGRPTILTASRHISGKGVDTLIDAVALLRKRIPDVLLLIAGTGPHTAALQQLTAERGLANNVRFMGFLAKETLQLTYRASDLVVVPSTAMECFGMVAIEALACGRPVLVTPVGGLPEVITDLKPDLVLRGVTAPHFADGMRAALEGSIRLPNPTECRTYAERFDWPCIADRVLSVYQEIA